MLEEGASKHVNQLVSELCEQLGSIRSPRAVNERLLALTRMGKRERRLELTVDMVALLIGRDRKTLIAEIERKRLVAYMSDGAWRVTPSRLRAYCLGDLERVDWLKCERAEVVSLLLRQWGVSSEGGG